MAAVRLADPILEGQRASCWRYGYSFFRQIMARAYSNARRCITQVNVLPPSTMISDPKKSQKKDLVAPAGDVGMWNTLFAFTFLIAVALSLAAIRLSL